jgi:hypothetical protein
MFRRELLLATALTTVMVGQAFADEYGTANHGQITIQQAASMMAYSAGNDQARVSIAPNWSEELGWSVRAAAGSYLGDAVALGAIVEYGDNKQEYLANLGFQLSETLSLIGTVGQLAEHKEFIADEGEDKASQMEYGLSLKADVASNLGLELSGYAVNSKASNDSIETGMLYGTEALAKLGSPDSTLVKIGGGYEWLEWDGGEKDDHWKLRSEANQQLTDMLALQGHAKLGASERSYGGGINLNFSDNGTNLFGVNYTYIDGRLGIADDKRVELSWTYGLGSGPSSKVAASEATDNGLTITAAADVAMLAPATNLLGDVMKRPAYLPERVLARSSSSSNTLSCESFTFLYQDDSPMIGQYYSTLSQTFAIYPTVAPALLEGRSITATFEGIERTFTQGMDPLALVFDRTAVEETEFVAGESADVILSIDGVPCPSLTFLEL